MTPIPQFTQPRQASHNATDTSQTGQRKGASSEIQPARHAAGHVRCDGDADARYRVVNTALARIARDLHSGRTGVQRIVDAPSVALATVVLTTRLACPPTAP